MEIIGLIPARYAAQRFPGKPLAPLCGEPMLHWVLLGCRASRHVTRWIVATDDERIAEAARSRGAEAALTDPDLPSGTDRIWAAGKASSATHFVNIQGDEPLVEGAAIDVLVETLLHTGADTATVARVMAPEEDIRDPNRVKVVVDERDQALYFSRAPIPYPRNPIPPGAGLPLLHMGMYGYTRAALERWVSLPPHPLERIESLEQLRALAHGLSMAVGRVTSAMLAVDTPEDVAGVEAALRARYGV